MTRTRLYRGTPRNLKLLAGKLRAGQLVAVPTETVYGLAANALDAAACARIFRAKGRPTTDPLIVHIHDLAQLPAIAKIHPTALRLAKAFWPGPLTLVLPKTDAIPCIVTAGKSSVAVRMPSHPLFRQLLRLSDLPLAAPSANPFGYVSPTTAQHVRESLNGKITCILDGGPAQVGIESTILDLRTPARPKILRPGAVTARQIGRILKRKISTGSRQGGPLQQAQLAPGQLKQHYSPKAKIILYAQIPAHLRKSPPARQALLFFQKPASAVSGHACWLSLTGDQKVAARNLFAKLRELDTLKFRIIHAELAPAGPLADAINDRLRRAAAKA